MLEEMEFVGENYALIKIMVFRVTEKIWEN